MAPACVRLKSKGSACGRWMHPPYLCTSASLPPPTQQDVYANFRGKDMTLAQARREAVVSAGRSAWEADRDAAVRAASPV